MKIAVVGAGVVGVTTSHELAADGHEVTVFERRGSVAAETSFANAGVVAPGYVTPWAGPGMPRKVIGHLLSRHAPVRVHARLSAGEIAWMWRWWRACRLRTWQANRLRMQRLAYFSRERLHHVTRELKLDYERSDGYLVLLRTAKDQALAQPGLGSLTELGTRFEMFDAVQCRAVEPGLNDDTPLHGGIYLPDDEVGNCRQFTTLLRTEAQRSGVRFRFHTEVQRVVPGRAPQLVHRYAPPEDSTVLMNVAPGNAPNDAQDTQPMPMQAVTEGFDAVVVCAALDSDALLRPHGLKLPMQAVHGYSITAPLRRLDAHGDIGPRSALMDERYKVAISRLGARVRVAGGAEIGGAPKRHDPKALETLYKVLHDWFPGSARLNQAQVWKGARPMLPDGPPVLGASGIEGVWLNLGHGSSGWALSCGSARLLADAIAGRPPAIDTEGLGVERLIG
ncbi:MAG: FAD-dependent oxidoreductase [Rhizobiales bacterium]|nr:FAD-dependent oxidoreductase [Rhizobacter sp.]